MTTKKVLHKVVFALILLFTLGFSSCDMSNECVICEDLNGNTTEVCDPFEKYLEEMAGSTCY